jgi:hypothetical protein
MYCKQMAFLRLLLRPFAMKYVLNLIEETRYVEKLLKENQKWKEEGLFRNPCKIIFQNTLQLVGLLYSW